MADRKAKITVEAYRCAPQGHTLETFRKGEIVAGQVAEWAIADGAGIPFSDKKPGGGRRVAAKKNAGAAPSNKSAGAAPENK